MGLKRWTCNYLISLRVNADGTTTTVVRCHSLGKRIKNVRMDVTIEAAAAGGTGVRRLHLTMLGFLQQQDRPIAGESRRLRRYSGGERSNIGQTVDKGN
jgi:hypothetical protein